jgi:hypothetical protein
VPLFALRKEDDAVRLITERLRVKEMRPADHIRAKHEVKAFVESGDTNMGQKLLSSARERLSPTIGMKTNISVTHSQGRQV